MKNFLPITLSCLIASTAVAADIDYSVTAQFSINSNPTGVWSYGSIVNGGAPFVLFSTNVAGRWGSGCTVDPINPALSSCAVFIRYDDGTGAVNLGDIGGPALALAKNVNASEISTLRFTAPSNGPYQIRIQAWTPWSFDVHNVQIRVNGSVVFSNAFSGPSMTFTNMIGLSAGQTIDFAGSEYNYFPQSRLNYVYLQGGVTLVDSNYVPPAITFLPTAGLFTNSVTVHVLNNMANGSIRLTTDGSNPGSASPLYSGPLFLTNATELRAAIFSNNVAISQVFTSSYSRVYAIDDGIPASWREHYFGPGYLTDPRVSADADPDGDLSTNWEEYLAGTDPTDPASGFKATVTAVPMVRFVSVIGRSYRLLRRDQVNSAPTVVTTITATSTMTTYVDTSVTTPMGIYMVELLP